MRTHPHIPRATVATVVAALALAACSGGDDAGTAASTEASSGVTAPVTSPATEPTAAPSSTSTTTTSTTSTTAAPTTTAPSTTTEASSRAPSSTSEDTAVGRDTNELEAALFAHIEAFDAARRDPSNNSLEAAAIATTTGAMTQIVSDTLDNMRSAGRASRPNPDVPSSQTIFGESIAVQGSEATLDTCWISSNILVEIGGGPSGNDLVIDDSVNSYIAAYSLTKVGAQWLVSSFQTLEKFEGQVGCD